MDEKNMCGLNFGIQFNVISPSAPGVTRVIQQIVHLILVRRHLPKFLNRHMDKRILLTKRIKIHYYKDDVIPRGGHLPVKQNRVIISGIEAQIRVHLKRAVLLPDAVYARDPIFDVSLRIPITLLELVLLGIEILLATWQRLVLE